MTPPTYMASKPRYEILDGLRGVAAIIVLLYHQFDLYATGNPADSIINHGYLAVDFFFILSGYVIGYAYDDRWGRMTLGSFFKRRLVRLHPMIVFGVLLGMVCFYFGAGPMFPLIAQCPVWKLLLCSLVAITMIPMPVSMDIRGWSEINAVNGNMWSLFFEYIANILYALVIRRLPRAVLAVLVGLFALLTLNLALNIDVFGVLGQRTAQAYTMIGGWTWNVEQMFIGTTRLLFPFFAGLLMSRLKWGITLRGGFWVSGLALAAVLVMPRVGGSCALLNGVYEALCVLAAFPLIVAVGAGSRVTGRSLGVCKFLGDISYPLYLVNYPLVYTLLGGWKAAHTDAPLDQVLFINAMVFMLNIFMAWAALKVFDEPVRAWLRKKLF